jgi:hypothetical protein
VFVASVVDAFSGSVVGRWLVTSKMLVLNSKNVYGGEPEGDAPNLKRSCVDDDGNISYTVEGPKEKKDEPVADGNPLVETLSSICIDENVIDVGPTSLSARDAAFPKTNGKIHELTFTQSAQERMRLKPTMAGCLLRSTKARGAETPYFVEAHGGFLYWTKLKPDGESRTGHTRVVSLSGASINGDAKGVTLTLPVPMERRRSSTDAVTESWL